MTHRPLTQGLWSNEPQAFFRESIILLLVWPAFAIASHLSGFDVWLENYFYDFSRAEFPWRHNWLLSHVLHDGMRSSIFVAVLAGLIALGLQNKWPSTWRNALPAFAKNKRFILYLFITMLSGPVIVGALKKVTTYPCPWDSALYGGHILPAMTVFSSTHPGMCLPGAHASAGFIFFAFIPFLTSRWRLFGINAVSIFGLLLGGVQMIRGAHFLSHNLWSAAIAWAITILSYYGFYERFLVRNASSKSTSIHSGNNEPIDENA